MILGEHPDRTGQKIHPGEWLEPDLHELRYAMRERCLDAADAIDEVCWLGDKTTWEGYCDRNEAIAWLEYWWHEADFCAWGHTPKQCDCREP